MSKIYMEGNGYGWIDAKPTFNRIDLIYFIYDTPKSDLIDWACENLFKQTIPCRIILIRPPHLNQEVEDQVLKYEFDEVWMYPEELVGHVVKIHQWAYKESNADYVVFNQHDDQSALHRVEAQIKVLKDNPKAAMAMCGFYKVTNGILDNAIPSIFEKCSVMYTVGYPSCWAVNKNILEELPWPAEIDVDDYKHPYEWDWDPLIIIEIRKKHPVCIMHEPLAIYNFHEGGSTALIKKEFAGSIERNVTILRNFYGNCYDELVSDIEIPFTFWGTYNQLRQIYFGRMEEVEDFPPQRILYIGRLECPRGDLVNSFRKKGHTVVTVGTDPPNTYLSKELKEADYYVCDQRIFYGHRRLAISEICDMIGQEFDWIFVEQTAYITFDFKNPPFPLYLWYHEKLHPHLPEGDIDGIFYSYAYGDKDVYWLDRVKFQHEYRFCEFLTFWGPDNAYFNDHPITSEFGFMGGTKCGNEYWNTEYMLHVYDKRNQFINHAVKKWGLEVKPKRRFGDLYKQYMEYTASCRMTLNVAGMWCHQNYHTFETPLSGSLLIQPDEPLLNILGYRNHGNCILASSIAEFDKEMKWIQDHPDEVEMIRKKGQIFVKTFHNPDVRAQTVLKAILTSPPKEPVRVITSPPIATPSKFKSVADIQKEGRERYDKWKRGDILAINENEHDRLTFLEKYEKKKDEWNDWEGGKKQ